VEGGASVGGESTAVTPRPDPALEHLVPIAVVIAAGCESCARSMVARALEEGSSARHIRKTLAVVAQMTQLDCLSQAVGPEVVARMEKPLAAGRQTLEDSLTCSDPRSSS
jgi:hypothetical protein